MLLSWDPFEEIRRIKKEIDKMISDFLGREKGYKPSISLTKDVKEPLIDIYETDNKIILLAEIPGVRKEDIVVKVSDDAVEISAEIRRDEKIEKANIVKREREYTRFRRFVQLPVNIDTEGAKATYKNGVLEIELPKSEEKKKVKIEVE